MAAIDRVIDGVKEVLRMTGEVKRLSDDVKALAMEVREIDKRLVRIETLAEVSRSQRNAPKRLT